MGCSACYRRGDSRLRAAFDMRLAESLGAAAAVNAAQLGIVHVLLGILVVLLATVVVAP